MQLKTRPFLKWPGGKYRLIERIQHVLPSGNKLIEPFVGSAAVFLNTHYESYLLNDVNPDLISVYQTLQQEGPHFINQVKQLFKPKWNTEQRYYQLRNQFNRSLDKKERAALFIYLNRHGYNGLCRYNIRFQEFNVPYGRYKKPYFPEQEMFIFYEKAKKAIFSCTDFSETLKRARKGNVVYCDPPYIPLSKTAHFTHYHGKTFRLEEQAYLAEKAQFLARRGIPVLLSNHATDMTLKLYQKSTHFTVWGQTVYKL